MLEKKLNIFINQNKHVKDEGDACESCGGMLSVNDEAVECSHAPIYIHRGIHDTKKPDQIKERRWDMICMNLTTLLLPQLPKLIYIYTRVPRGMKKRRIRKFTKLPK